MNTIKLQKYKIKKISKIGKKELIDFSCFPYPYYIANNILCHNCHNPQLQDFNLGNPFSDEDLDYLKERKDFFDIISFMGGDLMCQDQEEAKKLVTLLKNNFPDKQFWLFTGFEINELPEWYKGAFDYIKTGAYVEELRQEGFPTSSNQKLLVKGKDY